MVRGAAKAASQERNAKKQAAMKKSGTQLGCGEKALSLDCSICKTRMPTLQKPARDDFGSNTASNSGRLEQCRRRRCAAAPLGEYVFRCSSETEAECLDRRLLGCSHAMRGKVEGIVKGTPLVLYNIKSRRAIGSFTAAGPPQRNIAKGAFGGRFDLHVAFFDGPYELLFDASVDSKSGKGPDIGRWTTWESATATKRRRAAPRKASPS